MKIKIINKSNNKLPEYATPQSAGVDLRSNVAEPIEFNSLERKLVKTGIYLELPIGFEAQIRPRSGLAINKGITVLNTPGTIDSDYRGEIGVILINLSNHKVVVEPNERIAQMVISKHEQAVWEETESLNTSVRGAGALEVQEKNKKDEDNCMMAGRGSRLRPHTLTTPKPLISISGKPIVQRLVEDIAETCNEKIEEIAFIIGDFGMEVENKLKKFVAKLEAKGTIYYQHEPLGTAHAILCAKESLSGRCVVAFADTLFKTKFVLDKTKDGIVWLNKKRSNVIFWGS